MKDSKIMNKFLLIFMTISMILPMNLVHATSNLEDSPITIQVEDESERQTENIRNKISEKQNQKETEDTDIFEETKKDEKNDSTDAFPKEIVNEEKLKENIEPPSDKYEEHFEEVDNPKDKESFEDDLESDLSNEEVEIIEAIMNEPDTSNSNNTLSTLNSENGIKYYANRSLKANEKNQFIDDNGYLTVISEAWATAPTKYEVESHDIVLLFDQSAAADKYRDDIFESTKYFLDDLGTGGTYQATDDKGGHKVSILGYGRINNTGESNSSAGTGIKIESYNYNTGYYNKEEKFISGHKRPVVKEYFDWTEGTPPKVISLNDSTNYNKTFISPGEVGKLLNNDIISRWNAKASRLDVGLVLTDKIIDDAESLNKKLVLVFSNAVAIQNTGISIWNPRYNQRYTEAIKIADGLKNKATIVTIGQFNKVFDQDEIETDVNYIKQMKGVASKDENALIVYNNENSYKEQIEKAFQIMSDEITQGTNINIIEKFNPVFEIVESNVYKPEYIDYEEDTPIFHETPPLHSEAVVIDKEKNEVNYESSIEPIPEQSEDSPRGEKLVLETRLRIKDGFLGGNNVKTNIDGGLYNKSGNNKLADFSANPEINIPVKEISIDAKDKYTYLLNDLKRQELATVKVGDISLNLTKDNYGLEEWQTSGIEPITVKFTEKDNKNISLTSLKENKEYEVKVEVKPKFEADESLPGIIAKEEVADTTSNIYVFEPEFTFKDSIAYYGDEAPEYKSENVVNENNKPRWINKNKNIIYDIEKMIGPAPEITLDYNIENNKVENNIIKTKENILVDVTSHIGGTDVTKYTKFINTPLVEEDYNSPVNEPKFIILIKTVSLNIKKQGGSTSEPYVFTIYKDRIPYTEASVLGNNEIDIYELPVGTYTVDEDQKWSWRYKGDNGNKVTLSATNDSDVIIVKNTKDKNNWLNSFSKVIKMFMVKQMKNSEGGNR